MSDYNRLKVLHREKRDAMPDEMSLRVHRALSWLHVAEQTEDEDTRFLLLWISFNAAYAQEFKPEETSPEKMAFHQFLYELCDKDREDRIHEIAWDNYANKIRVFIDNQYVFQPFWAFQSGQISEEKWKELFQNSKQNAQNALMKKDSPKFLCILFDRIYTMRNQLIHGGATWGSQTNRDQVRDGTRILEQFLPSLIEVLILHPEGNWGQPAYPPVIEN